MLLKWVKWKNYVRWKHKWDTFKAFNKKISGKYLWIVLLGYDVISFFLSIIGSYLIFGWIVNRSEFSNDSNLFFMIVNSYSEILRSDPNLLWIFLLLFLIVFSISTGIKSSRWSDGQQEEDWILVNTFKEPIKRRYYLLIENIVWYFRDFILRIIPLFLTLSLLTKKGSETIYILLFVTLIYFATSIYAAFFHVLILKLVINFRKNLILSSLYSLLFRLSIVYLGYYVSLNLAEWLQSFPLKNSISTGEEYNVWLHDGAIEAINMVAPFFSFITTSNYFPIVMLHDLLHDFVLWKVALLTFVYIASLGCIFLIYKINKVNQTKQNYFDNENVFLRKLPIKFQISLKLFLNSEYTQKRFGKIFGGKTFWFISGFASGTTQNFHVNENTYYLFIALLLYHQIFFNVSSLYENFRAKLALESDGKFLLLYINAKKNLWDVFKRKYILGIILTLPSILGGMTVLFFLSRIDLIILGLIFISQIIFLFLSLILMHLPSIYSLHVEFSNPEQISEHPDNTSISYIMTFIVQGLFLPALLIPTALFLLNDIKFSSFLFWQFVFCALILIGLTFSIYFVIKSRLVRVKNLDDFL